VFVRERRGADYVLPADRARADALVAMCRKRELRMRGVHLSTPRRTQRVP